MEYWHLSVMKGGGGDTLPPVERFMPQADAFGRRSKDFMINRFPIHTGILSMQGLEGGVGRPPDVTLLVAGMRNHVSALCISAIFQYVTCFMNDRVGERIGHILCGEQFHKNQLFL